ncbi:MAG: response regulator transcription factor [Cyanobacteria bacterium SZAS LIN-2]|nr:response regulator transcription factor [Cyanobacteria bacterium SZAS LIN-2]MBS2009876.1 response regulator transcription factor [Cyanobacteria bacterium SZAS TMP-1]
MFTKHTVFVVAERSVAESARRLLGEGSDCQLIGHAETNNNLVAKIAELQPSVVLIEHNALSLDAMQAISEIRKTSGQVKILMLLYAEADIWSALESNADGYVLWPTTWLPTAIDVVTRGGVWLGPLIAEYLLRGPGFSILQSVAQTLTSVQPLFQLLSAREREVLNLLMDGLTNQQIANSLELSVGTVKVHVRHILSKLKLEHRGEVIVKMTKLRASSLTSSGKRP